MGLCENNANNSREIFENVRKRLKNLTAFAGILASILGNVSEILYLILKRIPRERLLAAWLVLLN